MADRNAVEPNRSAEFDTTSSCDLVMHSSEIT
jgi:hypothetical protein